MPMSRFEPLLSHKTSRTTGCRERIIKPSCFYHRKHTSNSGFDRPVKWTIYSPSPCRCSRRFRQLVWTPGSTTGGCTCPPWCVYKTSSESSGLGLTKSLVAHPSSKSTGSCCLLQPCCTINSCCCIGKHCNLPCCCCIPRPKYSPTKSRDRTPSSTSKLSCNCWRQLVGCCSCPARDILYNCQPVSNYCCCAWCRSKYRGPASKPTCCCSGKGCPACCRRKAESSTKALRFSSWLDEPFSPPVPVIKSGSSSLDRPYCCCLSKGILTFCLSTSQGDTRLNSVQGPRCICCTCKPGKLGSSLGAEEICVCPPWSRCKQKSTMAEATDKCPCCSYPLSGIIKPSPSADASPPLSIEAKPSKAEEPYISQSSVLEDDFACPHWCTCKSEHRKLRKTPQSNKEPEFDFNKADEYLSGKRLALDRIDLSVDSDKFLHDSGNRGQIDLDSDSDDSFRTCAWIRKSPLNIDDSDSDALSIIDSDDDLVRTSDSDSDVDLDCFGKTTFKPTPRGYSKGRDVKFLCNRPTINFRQ